MLSKIITLTLILIGIGGTAIKKLNLIGIILSLNISAVGVFLYLIILGRTNHNEQAFLFAFIEIIIIALLNAVSASVIYVYFNKKGTLDIEDSTRDID